MKDITIKPALNGWKVHVGCKEVLFTSRKKMFAEISRYINDPDGVEKEYLKKAKNNVRGQSVEIGGTLNLNTNVNTGGAGWRVGRGSFGTRTGTFTP